MSTVEGLQHCFLPQIRLPFCMRDIKKFIHLNYVYESDIRDILSANVLLSPNTSFGSIVTKFFAIKLYPYH